MSYLGRDDLAEVDNVSHDGLGGGAREGEEPTVPVQQLRPEQLISKGFSRGVMPDNIVPFTARRVAERLEETEGPPITSPARRRLPVRRVSGLRAFYPAPG